MDLYSASTQTPLTRSDTVHPVLPANNSISDFTRSHRASPPFGRYSLRLPTLPTEGWPGWVNLGGWLDWDKFPAPGVEPRYGHHPSTNRAWRRVTSLIWPTSLPTAPNRAKRLCLQSSLESIPYRSGVYNAGASLFQVVRPASVRARGTNRVTVAAKHRLLQWVCKGRWGRLEKQCGHTFKPSEMSWRSRGNRPTNVGKVVTKTYLARITTASNFLQTSTVQRDSIVSNAVCFERNGSLWAKMFGGRRVPYQPYFYQ